MKNWYVLILIIIVLAVIARMVSYAAGSLEVKVATRGRGGEPAPGPLDGRG